MKTKTNQKKATDPYTKEEMCDDIQTCVNELDGILVDLHDVVVRGRKLGADGTKEEKDTEKKVEILTVEVSLHKEILDTMRDEMDGYQKGEDLEVINYCETSQGRRIIRYLFVPGNIDGDR